MFLICPRAFVDQQTTEGIDGIGIVFAVLLAKGDAAMNHKVATQYAGNEVDAQEMESWGNERRDDVEDREDLNVEASFLFGFSDSGSDKVVFVLDVAAGECPRASAWVSPAFSQEHATLIDDQNTDGRSWILVLHKSTIWACRALLVAALNQTQVRSAERTVLESGRGLACLIVMSKDLFDFHTAFSILVLLGVLGDGDRRFPGVRPWLLSSILSKRSFCKEICDDLLNGGKDCLSSWFMIE